MGSKEKGKEMKRKPKEKESVLQKAIIEYLNKIGIFAFRHNTGAVLMRYKGKNRFIRFGIKGSSDILGIMKDGRFLSIEVKRKGETPTLDQFNWMDRIADNNGFAVWVDSWEAWESICRDEGWPI
jgi:hypothetical protein